jgi:diguanylate cyclase (GGDEF)-like protein
VLLFDIDHFKQINDHLGHAAGDRALRMVARCMLEHLRSDDIPGRHGGDEFVLLLRQTAVREAMAVAARIVVQIRQEAERASLPALSLSFGIVQMHPQEPVDDALRRADRALYEAKRQGRSRAVAADGQEDQPVFTESRRLGLT